MNEIYQIASNIYYLSLFPLFFLSFIFYFLLFFRLVARKNEKIYAKNFFPKVSIQIPVYNDPIVIRCIKSCLYQNYPKDRYEIIVVDDSDDNVTTKLLENFIKSLNTDDKKRIKIIRRNGRRGFKAGALNDALKISNGEIVVVLDSDTIIPKNFLRKIVQPFKDKEVALVQAKQVYLNKNQNIISKFAATLQSIYYNFSLLLYSKFKLTFCAGSAVAIRRSILEKFKWDEESVTEDMDLSLKIFSEGYKTVYLQNLKAKAEVPFKLSHLLKQQARWTFGICRAFIDNFKLILFSSKLNILQKTLLLLIFFCYPLGISIFSFTFSGIIRVAFDDSKPLTFNDFVEFFSTFIITSGFLFVFIFSAKIEKIKINDIFLPLFLGLLNTLNNILFFFRAFLSKKFYWYRTPKIGNSRLS
jgi:cellulose synthase/poly-beta-1,6-N-acetylglucosamine synthase-like glycosyltransferase